MAELHLAAGKRAATTKGETHGLRLVGRIPGIVYGKQMQPIAVSVDHKAFVKALEQAGLNALISLEIEGEEKPILALVRDLQREVVSRDIMHIDFNAVSMAEKISVLVALRLVGTAPGIKEGGILEEHLHQVEVECLPGDIPKYIAIDIHALTIGDSIFVSDLVIPEKVSLITEPQTAVVTMVPPKKVEEEVKPVEAAAAIKPAEAESKE